MANNCVTAYNPPWLHVERTADIWTFVAISCHHFEFLNVGKLKIKNLLTLSFVLKTEDP